MHLRFTVPFDIYLIGLTEGDLGASVRFRHKGYDALVSFPGG